MIESLESAVALLPSAEDLAESAPVSETSGGTSRPTEVRKWSDVLDADKVLVETIAYLNPVDSPGCAAVSGRSYSWEDR